MNYTCLGKRVAFWYYNWYSCIRRAQQYLVLIIYIKFVIKTIPLKMNVAVVRAWQ